MRLVQLRTASGQRAVAQVEAGEARLRLVSSPECLRDLALEARRSRTPLEELVRARLSETCEDYDQVIAEGRLLPPLDHPDPAHCWITGTGLTHLGSAKARDAMHADPHALQSDSMRLFQWGLTGGKPEAGEVSVQPEWFYKGNGSHLVPPGHPLPSPSFALDGGEEAELVGLYVVDEEGQVLRVGYALGNEFSDHVMEAQNYLYLAHSKLRACSIGPEVRLGPAPAHISGWVRIERGEATLWEALFLSGEDHMTYTLAALEHHHFKYPMFRAPGDVHCHFFGTATLSRNAGVVTQPGDVFEIWAEGFGRPLRNRFEQAFEGEGLVEVIGL